MADKQEEEEDTVNIPLTLPQVLLMMEQGVKDGHQGSPSPVPFSKKHPQMPRFHKMETMRTGGQVGIRGLKLCGGSQYTGPKCAICDCINDLKSCGRCKKVFYCDRECQKYHWNERGHKLECKKV
jgi:hypothetical protein